MNLIVVLLMKAVRLACCRLGRVWLVSALMLPVVRSMAGEALVLHEHGARRAHLHVLGSGDLLSAAAWSSRFGHCPDPTPTLQSVSQGVRVLAIVATGSAFVSTSRSTSIGVAGLASNHSCPLVWITPPQQISAIESPAFHHPVARVGRSATAVILLRNHTLLV